MTRFKGTRRERWKMWLVSWVSIAQEAIFIATLGTVCVDWRAHILFSEWMDR